MRPGYGTCPVCNGTGHKPCPDEVTRGYGVRNGWYGYRAEDDTVTCDNCGGQYMFGQPSCEVRLRPDGTPCTHEYVGVTIGRCLHEYTCKHCGDRHQIDSGD
jgi:hypothetical protein